jgi:hypothetical protein
VPTRISLTVSAVPAMMKKMLSERLTDYFLTNSQSVINYKSTPAAQILGKTSMKILRLDPADVFQNAN